MRMSSDIASSRKYVGTVSVDSLLSISQRVEYQPSTDTSFKRQKTTVRQQSSLPLENAQINLKSSRSHQRNLSDFIHSLFSGKKRERVEHLLGDPSKKSINASCPNLNNKEIVEKKFGQVHGEQPQRDIMNRASSAKKLTSSDSVSFSQPSLQVPNIFITSLTRSRSDDNCRAGSTTTTVRKSSSVFSEGGSNDTNEADRKWSRRAGVLNSESCPCNFRVSSQCRLYRNENMAQITPYLFVGRAESATDQRLLCKLDIHSLIDITNSPRNDHHMNLACPCTCTSNESHVHPKLYVNVENTETSSMKEHFPMINKFIDGSRELGRGTLIFSVSGRSRAPMAAIQYLVTCQRMALNEAYCLLKSRWPDTDINRGFIKCLIQLENMKATERNSSSQSVQDRCNVPLRPRVKNAWTEYPI